MGAAQGRKGKEREGAFSLAGARGHGAQRQGQERLCGPEQESPRAGAWAVPTSVLALPGPPLRNAAGPS